MTLDVGVSDEDILTTKTFSSYSEVTHTKLGIEKNTETCHNVPLDEGETSWTKDIKSLLCPRI